MLFFKFITYFQVMHLVLELRFNESLCVELDHLDCQCVCMCVSFVH